MANGESPPDPEDYVLRYGVRSGLKREFAFALKAQAQLPISLGRTRSGKTTAFVSPPSTAAGPRERKRPKKSVGDLTPRDAGVQAPEIADEAAAPSLSPGFSRVEAEANVAADCDDCESKRAEKAGEGLKPNSSSVSPVSYPIQEEGPFVVDCADEALVDIVEVKNGSKLGKSEEVVKCKNGSTINAPVVIEGCDESAVDTPCSLVKPIKVFIRSPTRGRMEGLVKSSDLLPPPGFAGKNSVIKVDDYGACVWNGDQQKNGCTPENPTVVEGNGDKNVCGLALDNQEEISTRSTEKDSKEAAAVGSSERPVVMDEIQPLAHTLCVVNQDGPLVGNCLPEKPFRRFTRSLLKVPSSVPSEGSAVDNSVKENCHDRHMDDVSLLDKPIRRFTRSVLKAKMEDSGAGEGTSTSSESSGYEETKSGTNAVNGSLDSAGKKKMELKMSKKISLTKVPSNVRELISTGLLEGLPVKYILSTGRQTELQGVIKGNGILCSCASCNACNVISAYVFEQHAGSTKKHPSDFIYLQNGNSLRDVLRSCSSATLDMLEAAILSAVGPWPLKKKFTCQKCKGSFLTTRTGKFALLCDECLDTKQALKTPTPNGNMVPSRLPRASLAPYSESHTKNCSSNKKTSYGKLTRKDVGLHKLVFMDDILPQGTEVGYYVRGKRLLEGYIKDSGIFCRCCEKVVSPSQFEAHAGRASRRKPYNNIYTSNGVSLHELSVSLSKGRKMSASENDDLCSICADGGNLLLCDLCPRAFHKECVGLTSIPKGDWYCQYCVNLHQRERSVACNDNAIAAGRVAGVDPIEQIFRRCIRIVTTSETDVGGCALCRLHHFSKSAFDDHTVIICDQCEKEYHVGCLRDHKMADLKELPEDDWFCCSDCSRIRASLLEFVHHGAQPLSLLDADLIKKKCNSKGVSSSLSADITWRLLSGKTATEDAKLLLSRAVAIFHESFDPIVDSGTGRDLIPTMVYGREVRDQDYRGMYCAILTVGSSVVSAGILRVLGSTVAELPLVATSRDHQGLGYFQSLFSCIERLLASLNVKHFVLPAADEAESIWTKKFGFTQINSDQLQKYLSGTRTTVFQGTSMLHKPVPFSQISCQG